VRRLVAVSNRVAIPKRGKAPGGLAVGVLSALRRRGGVWFGWSGKTTDREPGDTQLISAKNVKYATIDIEESDYDDYYNGFSNNTLWPLFHFMLGFFSFDRQQYNAYCRVNELFARKLIPLLEPDDVVWVHDYHLIPLGSELRRAGVRQPIGFFLHVPFPDFDVLRVLPCYEHILRTMASYDVVGFQTHRDLTAFLNCLTQSKIGGEALSGNHIRAFGRTFKADVFPIGIDVDACREDAEASVGQSQVRRLAESLQGRKLIIGVDRLDYSKGLELRFRAYASLLTNYPTSRGMVVFMQIAPPTRTGIRTYDSIREDLERTAGNINGRFAEMDWGPIRYLNRGYDRKVLMGLMRIARVGLVTPLRDGMNLVAKEYIASQDPENPGTLVLSTLCGAASELTDAILVNPYDMNGVAEGLQTAIEMPLAERRARHRAMLETVERNDIHTWCRRFIEALEPADAPSR
jgi:trehalose 6-phosphate synthase